MIGAGFLEAEQVMEPSHTHISGCWIPILILSLILGIFRWRWWWGCGGGWWWYSPWGWWFWGNMASSSQDNYVVTDDWTPGRQKWGYRDDEDRRKVPPPVAPPPMQPEADFHDGKLEGLINEGKLSEARKYLRDMAAIAREMNGLQCEANYKTYEQVIETASMEGRRLTHTETDHGADTDGDKLIHL